MTAAGTTASFAGARRWHEIEAAHGATDARVDDYEEPEPRSRLGRMWDWGSSVWSSRRKRRGGYAFSVLATSLMGGDD